MMSFWWKGQFCGLLGSSGPLQSTRFVTAMLASSLSRLETSSLEPLDLGVAEFSEVDAGETTFCA